MRMPEVNVEDSAQNAFVQDWLVAYYKRHDDVNTPADMDAYESVVECLQETYDYTDHQRREADG